MGLRLMLDKLKDLHCARHDCEIERYYMGWKELARSVYGLEINRDEMRETEESGRKEIFEGQVVSTREDWKRCRRSGQRSYKYLDQSGWGLTQSSFQHWACACEPSSIV